MTAHFARLVVATHNAGKLREFQNLLTGLADDITSAGVLGLAEPAEDGDSFRANAALKARAAMQATGLPALADDSGLCVTALDGKPGIHSARWGGPDRDIHAAMRRIETELDGNPDRRAWFTCALALALPDGTLSFHDGRVYGRLTAEPLGSTGHGYDPWFVPDGHDKTFAEMGEDAKNALSHRARALSALRAALSDSPAGSTGNHRSG